MDRKKLSALLICDDMRGEFIQ